MTDYNSMKADEYAQRQGEADDMDAEINKMAWIVTDEIPLFVWQHNFHETERACMAEAKRRVMQAIKERNEP